VIIDASVAFKLVVEEPGSDAAIDWLGRAELIGPALLHAEVANALWKRVLRKELADDGEADDRLADVARYVTTVDETPLMPRALRLAIELAHPVYDCVYLAMAEAMDDGLLTADDRFLRAVAPTDYASLVIRLGT
jgi:predicted nucleic acid-binding protein